MTINETTDMHVRNFFSGHPISEKRWTLGPAMGVLPNMYILEIGPGPRLNHWTYVTVGAWEYGLRPLELFVISDEARPECVELLTMVAFYAREQPLGLGHTIPIGRPFLNGSLCEHVYLSLPYTFGPDLEVIKLVSDTHTILWLFPITVAEKELLLESGLEALEERLESEGVEYWSPFRESVI